MADLRIFLYYFIFVFSILGVFSCKKANNTAGILTAAEQILEQYPDSALILLDSISKTYKLNNKEQNRFWLLQIQAKDKSYKNLASDTIIFSVRNYYKKKKDVENIALSYFYCGRVLQEQKKPEAAMAEYLKADEYAAKTENENLRGLAQSLIGEVLLNELLPTEAKEHFLTAAQHFQKTHNIKNQIGAYKLIGNAY